MAETLVQPEVNSHTEWQPRVPWHAIKGDGASGHGVLAGALLGAMEKLIPLCLFNSHCGNVGSTDLGHQGCRDKASPEREAWGREVL